MRGHEVMSPTVDDMRIMRGRGSSSEAHVETNSSAAVSRRKPVDHVL